MLDAAVQIFSVNGYHETSMDAIAAEAQISKPMLYLYYGSKEELFGACLNRELTRFVDVVRADIDFSQSPKDLLRNAVLAFLNYIDANRLRTTGTHRPISTAEPPCRSNQASARCTSRGSTSGRVSFSSLWSNVRCS